MASDHGPARGAAELRCWTGTWPRPAAAAAARGVVGIVDYEWPWQLDGWVARFAAGFGQLRVVASVWPSHLDEPIARGLRTGDASRAPTGCSPWAR